MARSTIGPLVVLLPEPFQLDALRRVMTRLFSEDRMTGDEMRDAAQTIEAILRTQTDLRAGAGGMSAKRS